MSANVGGVTSIGDRRWGRPLGKPWQKPLEERAQAFTARQVRERTVDVAKARRVERQEVGVLAHAIDEHEAARIFELALDGDRVEAAFERFTHRCIEAAALEVALEHVELKAPLEVDVGVAQERDEIVRRRTDERVLKVDHHQTVVSRPHQVARLKVAMHEAVRQRSKLTGQLIEQAVEHGTVTGAQRAFHCLETPLAKVIELGPEQCGIEAAAIGDARRGWLRRCAAFMKLREQVDRALVRLGKPGRAVTPQASFECQITEIFEDESAALEIGRVQLRHWNIAAREKRPDVEKRARLGVRGRCGTKRLGKLHDDHTRRFALSARFGRIDFDAEVRARRSVAFQLANVSLLDGAVKRRKRSREPPKGAARHEGASVARARGWCTTRAVAEGFNLARDRAHIARLAQVFGTPVQPAAIDALGRYIELVATWNRKLDLTAAKQPEALVEVLLADALMLASNEIVPAHSRCVDVGSGAGAPGLPLAILREDLSLTLVEPLRKRVAFLRTTLGTLQLVSRLKVIEQKLDPEAPTVAEAPFDVAMSRATFAPELWLIAGIRLAPRTLVLLAQQAPPAAADAALDRVVSYTLPSNRAARKIAIYQRI